MGWRMMVVPLASAPATASAGNSSISCGISFVNHRTFERHTGDFGYTARFQLVDAFKPLRALARPFAPKREQCRPSVIQSDVANEQMAAGLGSGRDQPKGGRRNVAWN